jgi:hypothetical protein
MMTIEELIKLLRAEYDEITALDEAEAESGELGEDEIEYNNGWACGMARAIQLAQGGV